MVLVFCNEFLKIFNLMSIFLKLKHFQVSLTTASVLLPTPKVSLTTCFLNMKLNKTSIHFNQYEVCVTIWMFLLFYRNINIFFFIQTKSGSRNVFSLELEMVVKYQVAWHLSKSSLELKLGFSEQIYRNCIST